MSAHLNEIKFAALGERIEIGIVNNEKEYQFFLNIVCEVFQKHGLCTSLADYAIKEAISSGCQYAVSQLMTPGMAEGISKKMGAQTHCKLLPFLKDPRAKPISA